MKACTAVNLKTNRNKEAHGIGLIGGAKIVLLFYLKELNKTSHGSFSFE